MGGRTTYSAKAPLPFGPSPIGPRSTHRHGRPARQQSQAPQPGEPVGIAVGIDRNPDDESYGNDQGTNGNRGAERESQRESQRIAVHEPEHVAVK